MDPRFEPMEEPSQNMQRQLFSNAALDANQDIRHKKVQELLAETRQSSLTSEAIDIGRAAFKTTLNILSNTILSVDLADPNSDTARKFKEIVWNIMKDIGKPNLADYFPVLKKINPQGIRQRMIVNGGKMIDLFAHLISERLQLRKVSSSILNRDILDTLLNMIEENSEKMDKTTMEHFFLVSRYIITLCSFVIYLNISHLFTLILMNML
jgi:Zn-dependent M16 (insulinase) family peptidase